MPKSKAKKEVFSATKAVKANARERLGTPPPSHPLPTIKDKITARPKHKETLADLLEAKEEYIAKEENPHPASPSSPPSASPSFLSPRSRSRSAKTTRPSPSRPPRKPLPWPTPPSSPSASTAFGKDQDATYASATETSNAIVSAITASGVAKDAIQSQEQNLTPLNSEDFQNKSHYAEGMRFQFSQRWQVTVPADQAAKVLQAAITHGANNSGGIDWQLKNDDALQAEAAQKALSHARAIAEHMAQGLGAKLGTLLYASNQIPVVSGIGPRMYSMAGSPGSASA